LTDCLIFVFASFHLFLFHPIIFVHFIFVYLRISKMRRAWTVCIPSRRCFIEQKGHQAIQAFLNWISVGRLAVRHLWWVPHRLSDAQKSNRIELSWAFLSILKTQQGNHSDNITNLDVSWFYLNADHESIWLPPDAKGPEKELHRIQSEKLMSTIVWSLNGFHVINVFSQ
jgi:hypothetical protein